MTSPQLSRVVRPIARSTAAHVYAELREAIIAATLEPGRQLSENELAAWLGVSRTPVREAVARLRDDRLVEIVPQLGTFVARISVASVHDAQFVREALECSAVRLAAQRAMSNEIAALEGILRHQEAAVSENDSARFAVLDDELHSSLCELSGHGVAWALVQRANGHLDRVRRLSLPQPHYLAEMLAEHRQVVGAVGRAEPDAAEQALRHHLRMVLSELPAIRANHPEYFAEES
jgi:GntR family transcriptional regulator, rspAB operon transcriptional repressor